MQNVKHVNPVVHRDGDAKTRSSVLYRRGVLCMVTLLGKRFPQREYQPIRGIERGTPHFCRPTRTIERFWELTGRMMA
jgi:hypothetical protein